MDGVGRGRADAILGGVGTIIGPILGAGLIKYFENTFSSFNDSTLEAAFNFLPDAMVEPVVAVTSLFVGEGWHLSLGILFMIIVIFLPGGLTEGLSRLGKLVLRRASGEKTRTQTSPHPGE